MLIHSAILLKYQLKRVPENFRCCHTPLLYKMGGVNQPQVEKIIKRIYFLSQLFQYMFRGIQTVLLLLFFLKIVMHHVIIYVETMRFWQTIVCFAVHL